MLIKKYKILSLLALVALGYGCEQSAPANIYEEKGDLYFSGYYFNYKNKITPVGPGPNRFLGDSTAAWVDNQQKLHLKIQQKNQEIDENILDFDLGTALFYQDLSSEWDAH
jgi:hypothetical protein